MDTNGCCIPFIFKFLIHSDNLIKKKSKVFIKIIKK